MLGMTAGIPSAQADCTWLNGQSTHDYTFALRSMTVPLGATVGTILYSPPTQAPIPPSTSYATCSSGGTVNRSVTGGEQVSSNPYTFATNVPGIGMRFYDSTNGANFRYWGAGNGETWNGEWGWGSAGVAALGVQVVVTGPVSAGTIDGSLVATMRLGNLTIANLRVTTANVVIATCQIDAVPTVQMPRITAKDLATVGASAGKTAFTIRLNNCPAGMKSITYQLDAPAGVINATNGTFLASDGSTSKGVGFALKNQAGAAFALGKATKLTAYNATTGGNYPLQFSVLYYRSGAITLGTVNGSLTYTMTYQ